MFGAVVRVPSILHIFVDLGKRIQALFGQQADFANEPAYTACCEGATGEAEEEDLIAGVVVVCEEGVRFPDFFCEPFAGCASNDTG